MTLRIMRAASGNVLRRLVSGAAITCKILRGGRPPVVAIKAPSMLRAASRDLEPFQEAITRICKCACAHWSFQLRERSKVRLTGYSEPFVLATWPLSRSSTMAAVRSARASDLKLASAMWCEFSP